MEKEIKEIQVFYREIFGKNKINKLRTSGLTPAIVYGNGLETTPLSVNVIELLKIFNRSPKSKNTILKLTYEKDKKKISHTVLTYRFEHHPVSRVITHIDFLNLDLKKKIQTNAPVSLEGKAPGVKMGGILIKNTDVLKIICLPDAIPEKITVDVSKLNLGDNYRIQDLPKDEHIEILNPKEQILAQVQTARIAKGDEEAAATPAAGAAAPAAGAAAPAGATAPAAAGKEAAGKKEPAGKKEAAQKK